MALRLERRHKGLGVPVVVTSAVVSTAIFGTLQQDAAIGWKIATGFLSLAAAVLAALRTFFDYSDLAHRHLTSARAWSGIRRRLSISSCGISLCNPMTFGLWHSTNLSQSVRRSAMRRQMSHPFLRRSTKRLSPDGSQPAPSRSRTLITEY